MNFEGACSFPRWAFQSVNLCHWTLGRIMEFSRQEYWSGKPFPSPGIPFVMIPLLFLSGAIIWLLDSLDLSSTLLLWSLCDFCLLSWNCPSSLSSNFSLNIFPAAIILIFKCFFLIIEFYLFLESFFCFMGVIPSPMCLRILIILRHFSLSICVVSELSTPFFLFVF